jgi:hypothetical protein
MSQRFFQKTCLIAAALLTGSAVHAQPYCSCSGQLLGSQFADGDGQPLKWRYAPFQVVPGAGKDSAIVCYLKQVDNESGSDVRDVRWAIANFFRRVIPQKDSRASCPLVAGETKQAPTNGPLFYGTSSVGYETTVLEPKNGWGDRASNDRWNSPDLPTLGSQIVADVEDRNGKLSFVRLMFESSATKKDIKAFLLNYEIENESNVDIVILVNLAATPQMLEKIPFQRRFQLGAGKRISFSYAFEGGELSVQPATVVLYDPKERISAIDTAGFYTIYGATKPPDQSFWQSIR